MTTLKQADPGRAGESKGPLESAPETGPRLKVCQVNVKFGTQSETFVRAHQEHLPFAVEAVAIEAWDKPVLRTENGYAFPRDPLSRFLRRMNSKRVRHPLNARFRRALASHLRRNRFDCVLAEYGPVGAAVADPCAAAQIPLIVHFHGFDAHVRSVVEEMQEDYRRLFQTASAVVAVSRTMREALVRIGCPERKIHVVPCGVDVDHFDLRPLREARPESPFQFLFVGRFVNKKAPVHLLLAFQRCLQTADARLVMAGDGPLLDLAREVAGALGLAERVRFPGAVSHDQVRRLLLESDAYAQHSIQAESGDCEGSPVAIVEAAAASLPVVSTRHAGIVDSVVEDSTGFLVDEGDVDQMGQKMAVLAQDRELCRRFGTAGREHICRHYSMAVTTGALANVVRAASAAGRPAHSG